MSLLSVHRPSWELSILVETRDAPLPNLDRMSGLPLGLPRELWPACGECGAPLAFIGQFACDPSRLPGATPSSVVYAFLCDNQETFQRCHMWQLEPLQQRIGRAIVCEPPSLTFTEPPPGLPVRPRLGLVAMSWTTATEDSVEPEVDWEYLDDEARTTMQRREFLEASTRIGGRPRWLQEPFFQNDRERPERYQHVAGWDSYVPVATRLFESTWMQSEVAQVQAKATRYLDVQRRIAGWELDLRVFNNLGYVLIDGTMVRLDADGVSTVHTSLAGGRLYLLADTFAGGFELYYIGR
jgi:hypothetical protein